MELELASLEGQLWVLLGLWQHIVSIIDTMHSDRLCTQDIQEGTGIGDITKTTMKKMSACMDVLKNLTVNGDFVNVMQEPADCMEDAGLPGHILLIHPVWISTTVVQRVVHA